MNILSVSLSVMLQKALLLMDVVILVFYKTADKKSYLSSSLGAFHSGIFDRLFVHGYDCVRYTPQRGGTHVTQIADFLRIK